MKHDVLTVRQVCCQESHERFGDFGGITYTIYHKHEILFTKNRTFCKLMNGISQRQTI